MEGVRSKPYERGGRLRRFLLANLGVLGLFALVALAYFFLFYRPNLINRAFPVTLPESRTVGQLGEVLVNEGLELRVGAVERVPSEAFGDIRVSSRARPDRVTDYVILFVTLSNVSDTPKSLRYYGSGQDVEFLLGARRPRPDVMLAAQPRETELITRQKALPGGELAPGETASGYLVFPTNQAAKDLSLLVMPSRYRKLEGIIPSFEVGLEPPD